MTQTQTAVDRTVLAALQPIGALSRDRLDELAALCFVEKVNNGRTLFEEGEKDNQTVYLLKGDVALGATGVTIRGGSAEAKHPLADKQPRLMTATAASEVEVLRIDNDLLDIMLTWDQLTQYQAGAPADTGGKTEDWMGVVSQSPAFKALPAANIEKLSSRMEKLPVKAAQIIIRQGDEGDYYYVIESGKAKVLRHSDAGVRQDLAELGPGTPFGEEALISDAKRNATVAMLTDGVLLRLAKKDFIELLREPLLNWVTQQEAVAKVKTGRGKWLDVRHATEYQHARVPGAVLCPLHELRNRANGLDKDVEYICYCKTGRRSSAAAFLLSQRGIKAYVLKGGLQTLPD